MRACATASSVLLGLALAGGFVVACGNAGPPAQPPPSGGETAPPASAAPEVASPTSPADSAKPSAPPAKAAPPASATDCANMPPSQAKSDLAGEPDGGLCMNNAMTSADAGSSDRCQGIADVIKPRRDAFRCCYDLYAQTHKSKGEHVVLHVSLAPDGTLKSTAIQKERSSISPPDLDACMAGVAKGLSFPKSPKGKETEFNYPFDFHSRSRN